jgi:hypothetical protein
MPHAVHRLAALWTLGAAGLLAGALLAAPPSTLATTGGESPFGDFVVDPGSVPTDGGALFTVSLAERAAALPPSQICHFLRVLEQRRADGTATPASAELQVALDQAAQAQQVRCPDGPQQARGRAAGAD